MNTRLDRRKEKTKAAIFYALLELMQQHRYSQITIQNIIDHANVGRSTFYAHFGTKDELLEYCIESICESLHEVSINGDEESTVHFIPVEKIFIHIQENKQLIKGLISAESSELLFKKFKDYWNHKLEIMVSKKIRCSTKKIELNIPMVILTNYIMTSLIEIIKWWIEYDTLYTPAQMQVYWEQLVLPSISAAFAIKEDIEDTEEIERL